MIDSRLITLRTFAQCGTVAATADLMGYSASAVSGQLRELQRALGMTLLVRDGRGLRLTATGRDLVRRSDALITQWEEVRAAALSAGGQVPAQFGIGGFSTAASQLLAPLARHLHGSHPSLEVSVWEASPARCFELLVAERIDLAVVVSMQGQVHLEEDPRFEKIALLDDPLDVMVPSDHAVAGRDSVALAELVGEAWITDQSGSPYRALFTAAFTAAGLSPRISHEATEWETAIALVGAGVGVGLLPRLVSLAGAPNVSRVRLTGAERLSRKVIAAARSGSQGSPLPDESIRFLREVSRGILATRLDDEANAAASREG
ncbi:LysR family transcriptional regulator [Microbacterium sp. G2-8]|uniref:LysR family transcriptional regulator n=1 Tax=Microbacterium sp. G2-8 TaxID=2842454 RepID=UPI001C8A7C4B|nr:LysR family transcriptional regulator [Microbacterium sp. G2-8]